MPRPPRKAAAARARQRAQTRALPDVHPDLEGFDVELNRFGEVDMTIPIDRLNDFLDREVDDPKLTQWGFGAAEGSGSPAGEE